ncbi:hypothetical protein BGX30_003582, partial [Mortierella sp. GBA39]
SRIKGHTKRGGQKITHQHRQNCIVGHTDEYRTGPMSTQGLLAHGTRLGAQLKGAI